MPLSREVLEQQLEAAKKDREEIAARIGNETLKRDPQWRAADALCRQLTRRLRRVKEVEELDAELRRRRDSEPAAT